MFNNYHRSALAKYLTLHGFMAVGPHVYIRMFALKHGQATLEVNFVDKPELITSLDWLGPRERTESFGWGGRDRDMLRMIVDQETQRFVELEAQNRFEQACGPCGTTC